MPPKDQEFEQEDSRSADIEAAFAAVEAETQGEVEPPEQETEGLVDEDLELGGADEESSGEIEPPPESRTEGETDDEGGGDKATGADEEEDRPGDSSSDGDTGRAPVSWSPAVREHWGKLPDEVKEQVLKREKEITQALGQSTAARRFADEWVGMIKPYEPLMAAQQATPYQAVKRLLEIGAGLATGTQAMKSYIISELVKQYEVDLRTLDATLAQGPQIDPTEVKINQLVEQRLAPFQQEIQRRQQYEQQLQIQAQQELATELSTFATDPANEFFKDVRYDMADIMEMAARRKQTLSLKDAYNQACRLNPEVSKVLEQRTAVERARKQREEIERRRRASSSVHGSQGSGGGVGTGGGEEDLRSALEKAVEAHSTRTRTRV